MNSTKRALVVVMLTAFLGLWGCSQNGTGPTTSTRLRELEAKTARLEDDFKAAIAARDQIRTKLNQSEEQRLQVSGLLDAMTRDRDLLKGLLQVKTVERDALHSSLTDLGRELQSLVVKIQQATGTSGSAPGISAPPVPTTTGAPGS